MAKRAPSFNFGANARPKTRKKKASTGKKAGAGKKSNAWRAYVGVSNAPIPD